MITVIGAGSWGTALADLLGRKGVSVRLWTRDAAQADYIRVNCSNNKYLKETVLSENIEAVTALNYATEGAEMILLSVASQATRSVLESLKPFVRPDQIIINVSKGIEMNSLQRISEIVANVLPNNPYCVLSGPSHAEEVAAGMPTTLVSASRSRDVAEAVQDLFSTGALRVYTNPDVAGVELAGALKNIIAIGAGISDGLGFGDNAKAALITRGITEIARLGTSMGARTETFAGLSGIGDLIVTCTSEHSRNRRFGRAVGQGMPVKDALDQIGMVVEGYYTVSSAYDLSQKVGVEMPITEELYRILYQGCDARHSVGNLMLRSLTHESEGLAETGLWE